MKTNIPDQFKTGYRILMLTLRSKDRTNETESDRRYKHVRISSSYLEFDKIWNELSKIRKPNERIYSTVDERDFEGAIRLFKYRQLDADYFGEKERDDFYLDVENRFISCLQNPKNRLTSLFMVDIDDEKNEYEPFMKEIRENNIEIVLDYPTKNGRHLVLKPFNPALVTFTILKNHMLLIEY